FGARRDQSLGRRPCGMAAGLRAATGIQVAEPPRPVRERMVDGARSGLREECGGARLDAASRPATLEGWGDLLFPLPFTNARGRPLRYKENGYFLKILFRPALARAICAARRPNPARSGRARIPIAVGQEFVPGPPQPVCE